MAPGVDEEVATVQCCQFYIRFVLRIKNEKKLGKNRNVNESIVLPQDPLEFECGTHLIIK